MLLSGAVNLRNIQGSEAANAEASQDRLLKMLAESQKLSHSPIRQVGGRQLRDKIDGRGVVIETEDLGPVEPQQWKPDLFQTQDGKIKRIGVGEDIPEGARPVSDSGEQFRYFESPAGNIEPFPLGTAPPPGYKSVTTRSTDLTEQQEINLRMQLASIDNYLVTSKGGDGKALTGPQIDAYVETYNEQAKVYGDKTGRAQPQFMKIPPVEGNWAGFGSKPAQAVKLPFNSKLNRHLTPQDIENVARNEGKSVREVLQALKVIE